MTEKVAPKVKQVVSTCKDKRIHEASVHLGGDAAVVSTFLIELVRLSALVAVPIAGCYVLVVIVLLRRDGDNSQ